MCDFRTLRTSAEGLSPPFQARTGRIKVIGADFSDFGYLGDGATVTSSVLGAGASATEAITVCYIPGAKLFEIEIKVPPVSSPPYERLEYNFLS